ncbi:DegV family protein [Filobacillus milosensis]|uniref:DegV family protein n=1 Tax=Filobacillus milosensis TaxID=94137 RepID=A0A4Y8IE75_9BACI|nr:DegV family protein [Filobacillus milosensis]TFB13227.1 DegV family protein [Filobacillus milosensis]
MTFQLMVDGGADLSKDLLEKYDVKIVPLNIHFNDEEYKGIDLDIEEFYRMVSESEELPKTSASSPNDFYNHFKEVDPDTPILMLALTKNLSATYQNAVLGKEMLQDEEPNRTIEIINTKTASSGIALLLNEAGQLREDGAKIQKVASYIEGCVEKTTTLFSLKTVENLIKGGRLDKMRGAIAKTLNIKLLMKASEEGAIEVVEKVRGEKKALRRLVEQIGEYTKSLEGKTIALAHGNCEEKAKKVLASIREKYNPKEEILVEMGPLIATHAGEGGLVLAFLED